MQEITGRYTTAKIYSIKEDEGVNNQVQQVCDHPVFANCKIRIMPDCHKGKGCTIGFTSEMPKNGEIIPNIIGVDQSCGMLAVKIKECKTLRDYYKLDKVIRQYVPAGTNGRKTISPLVADNLKSEIKKISNKILKEDESEDLLKIGSLGSGNHFVSLEKGKDGTYLIIHSGSRNFGKKLAVYFQGLAIEKHCYEEGELKNLSYIEGNDAADYLYCAEICRQYASLNRKIMVQEILDNMGWKSEFEFETVHNYIGKDNIIRKGAISCNKGETVLIPLNMADGSIIAVGKGNEDWNNSAPHGAGRLLSRTQAKDTLLMSEYKQMMKGIHSTCISTGTLDESPMAYKSGDEIIEAIRPAAEIIDKLKPVYNYKHA
ncbi:RtcB family protein [bacterium]|nr:RtcB family protein [bacterium]